MLPGPELGHYCTRRCPSTFQYQAINRFHAITQKLDMFSLKGFPDFQWFCMIYLYGPDGIIQMAIAKSHSTFEY